jgi:hypothetical protein
MLDIISKMDEGSFFDLRTVLDCLTKGVKGCDKGCGAQVGGSLWICLDQIGILM